MNWDAICRALFGPGTWGTAGNLVASVLLFVLGILAAWLGRHKIRAWWKNHHPHGPALAEIREIAEKAHRIAADTYEHHTGMRHPDSPERGGP